MEPISLTGVRILVSASSGLGLAMSEALLRAGASVALAARQSSKLDSEVKRLVDVGYDAHKLPMDVRSEDSVSDAVTWVRETWGSLDVLVNNAGIGMRTVNPRFMVEPLPFYEVTPDGFRDVIDTNLTYYFLVARGFAPMMVAQGHGKIINISMNHATMRRGVLSRMGRLVPGRSPCRTLWRKICCRTGLRSICCYRAVQRKPA
ncbi:hypothetical protein GCM10025858_13110 [Alicyclobacillus sacchari]|uniref:SDR family NAD(P)-dependent oxidoreductase n=1 Tax=Alicyclobacillus sacchari TaxID=392010 RepID=UPI0023E9F901|nr:SDR family NAD(P)-dependent oxidoreductase [Alicyclobacillus sacchari]GMA56808.1 hypothetical protein GCM10025858_13110 [Alicyclobacillus sacchari]